MRKEFVLRSLTILVVVALITFPMFLELYWLSLILSIIYWSALAASWNFFSGVTKYISLGSAAFFGLGVYALALTGDFVTGFLLALSIGFLASFAVGLVTLRLAGMYFAIFTFGLSELLKNIFLWWETTITGTVGRWLLLRLPPITTYYIILVVSTTALALIFLIGRTKLGIALRAVGENEGAASHLGINVSLYKSLGFAVSSTIICLVGACVASRWTYVDPRIAFDPLYSFMPAIMTLFGGMGRIEGSIMGAIVISLISEFLLTGFRDYYMIILGSLLLIILCFMPNGMVETVTKIRVPSGLSQLFLKSRATKSQ